MAKLVVHAPGEPVWELDLPPGLHQVGRSPNAHYQINHPSVSSFHCQIAVEPDRVSITDLGSTNGTWIEGRRVQQQPLLAGQRLRLGEVEAVFESQAERTNELHLASTPGCMLGFSFVGSRDLLAIYRLLAVEFLFLYFTVVEMRLLGVLYLSTREKLAWKL